jgi:predicted transcriptional regulator of viral defense system
MMEEISSRLTTAQAIRKIGKPIFTTREIAMFRGSSISSTSQSLSRLDHQDLVKKVSRGLWCLPNDPRFSQYALVPFLVGAHRAYISLISALHLRGIIEQIPEVIYAVTTGHPRLRDTSVGTFSFHRVHPYFFVGFDWYGNRKDFLVATPEKALVDSLYISSRRNKRFRFFPEINLGDGFSFRLAYEWAHRIKNDQWTQEYVIRKLEMLETNQVLR